MVVEARMVFDRIGVPIFWDLPEERTATCIPDSRQFWLDCLHVADIFGGFIHTHPWGGVPEPSQEDVTTFAAFEGGLALRGERYVWPIATFEAVRYFTWVGPGRLDYAEMQNRRIRIRAEHIYALREASRRTQ